MPQVERLDGEAPVVGAVSAAGSGRITPGTPWTKLRAGTSLVTTAPAAMKLRSPMWMPGSRVTPPPIMTSSSIVAPRGVSGVSCRPGIRSLRIVTPGPMKTWSPIHVRDGM